MPEETKWTAVRLVQMIRAKYEDKPGNGSNSRYVVCEQVADGTGFNVSRHIDVVAFAMWNMDGLHRHAFEVKVSRSDFIREMQQPDKHKWCQESFHYFWFVAPEGVAQLEELPTGAGLMVPRGEKLTIRRHAVLNHAPKLDDTLLASFMRSAWKEIRDTKKEATDDFLRNNPIHLRAAMMEKATTEFLSSRHIYLERESTGEEIKAKLAEATMDKELRAVRDHVERILERFQRELIDAAATYLAVAGTALVTSEEYAEEVAAAWGSHDGAALKVIQEARKKLPSEKKQEAERKELTDEIRALGTTGPALFPRTLFSTKPPDNSLTVPAKSGKTP